MTEFGGYLWTEDEIVRYFDTATPVLDSDFDVDDYLDLDAEPPF
jgi:hypothetical protein